MFKVSQLNIMFFDVMKKFSSLRKKKERALSLELVTKFLPSVRLKSRNNIALDAAFYKTDVT